jgi:hypothetical protein
MPSALATMPAQTAPATTKQQGPLLPFTRGAVDHAEPFFDQTFTLSAAQQILGPIDVAAYGYARAIVIQVDQVSATNAATVTVVEDSPWSLFAELVFQDVNGAPIFQNSGYEAYVHHKYGGFRAQRDPKLLPPGVFSATVTGAGATAGSGKFLLRMNLERSARDGLGALGNMNASQAYKVRGTINNLAGIFGVSPTNAPTARIRMTLEAYSQPNATDDAGRAQMTAPPANQTTGYSSRFQPTVNAGQNTVRHTRVGNLIRNLTYIQRRTGTSRANGELDLAGLQLQWFLDSRLWTNLSIEALRTIMAEAYGLTNAAAEAAGGIDNGVFVLPLCIIDFDGYAGFEMRDMLMPTTQATRLELQYTLANAGVLTVMTDDVAPRGDIYIS